MTSNFFITLYLMKNLCWHQAPDIIILLPSTLPTATAYRHHHLLILRIA